MIGEKGADLIKDLWLQPGVVRAEREAAKAAKAAHAAEGVETTVVTATRKKKATTVYANATAA